MKLLTITFLAIYFLLGCGSPKDDQNFLAPEPDAAVPLPTSNPIEKPGASAMPTTRPSAAPTASNISSLRISSFIWKPASERDEKLVILVNPTNVRIVVTGSLSETLRNSGPSNGKGSTGRSSFSGCAFGNNVIVEFFDSSGRRILTRGGRSSVGIPRGCERFEF